MSLFTLSWSNGFRLRAASIAGVVLQLLVFADTDAEAQIIDKIETRTTNNETTVLLTFNIRLNYLSHIGFNKGRGLQVRLRRMGPDIAGEQSIIGIRQPTRRSRSPGTFEDVRVGDTPSGPILVLRFSEPSNYIVRSTSNGLGLVVVAHGMATKSREPIKPTAPQPPEHASGPSTAVPAENAARPRGETPERYQVQLSASPSAAVAEELWRKLVAAEPSLLSGITHEVTEGRVPGRRQRVGYFLRTAPLSEKGAAVALCRNLRQRGHDCFVIPARRPSRVAVPRDRTAEDSPRISGEKTAFAIDLLWSAGVIDPVSVPYLDAFRDRRLYTRRVRRNQQPGYQLRLGFFATRQEALRVLPSVRDRFVDAQVVDVDFSERRASAQTAITVAERPPPTIEQRRGRLPPVSADRLNAIMADARKAMTARNYDRAVQLFTKLLQYPEHAHSREAQELLGLARARKGQVAHAKVEYETYLRLYPDGEGADRVRQRLAALLTSRAQPKKKLRAAKREMKESEWETQLYGGLFQAYSRQERFTDLEGRITDRSDIFTDLDLTGRVFKDEREFKLQFVGGHAFNFLDETDANESRVSNLYFDMLDRGSGWSTRIGRQSQSSGGVLGRFDGGKVGYQIVPEVTFNLIGGFPIESTTSMSVDTDDYFYGASVDLGRFADHWDFNLFAIEQWSDSILDRRAIGGEARFTDIERGSVFSLFDYDISYNVLNIALLTGNFALPDKTTLNVVLDYRRSPIQTTTNGLQGLSVADLSAALNSFSEDTLRDFAEDRTAISRSVTLGASRPLDDRFQVSADVTVSHLSDTTASGGVEATSGTGYEFLYTAQLIGTNLIKEGDTSILGLSFADRDGSNTVSANLNTRYPVNHDWRINPRLRTDYRWEDLDSAQNRFRIRPSMKTEYRLKRWLRFEFEIGAEWTTQRFVDETDETAEFFTTLGYRVDY